VRKRVALAAAATLLVAAACEPVTARVNAPRGADAFARFSVIGGAVAAGVQSGGLVAASQSVAWPAIIASRAGTSFRLPVFRSPGCSPPLVAPLIVGRWLSGAAATSADSSCAGAGASLTLPADNLSLPDATAWSAVNLTPKLIATTPAAFGAGDRARYPLTLANTQSQVTAAVVQSPTFVAIELGLGEVIRAATSGSVVVAASYTQATPWSLVPATLFATAFDAVADSIARTNAPVVIVSIPPVTSLPAFRSATALWAERTTLAGFGVTLAADCGTSPNVIHAALAVPAAALRALASGAPQALGCTDLPGAADNVLTPSDVAAISSTVTQMNARLKQVATTRGWAFADLDVVYTGMAVEAGAYAARDQMGCVLPYGYKFSLDGMFPSVEGQRAIANAVIGAINSRYGFTLPVDSAPTLELRPKPCP
jgi:hypothetical protein